MRRQDWTISAGTQTLSELKVQANAATGTLTLEGAKLAGFDLQTNAGDVIVDGTGASIHGLDVQINAARARITLGPDTSGDLQVNAGAIDLCLPQDASVQLDVTDQITFATNLSESGLSHSGTIWTRAGLGSGGPIDPPHRRQRRHPDARPRGRLSMNEHLYRSRDDRIIAGVAGGLAELWDLDPSVVRIVWALLMLLTGGIFLLIYVIMWIVVPEEGSGRYGTPVPPWPADPNAAPGAAQAEAAPPQAADAQATAAAPATAWTARAEARQARHAAREARRAARRARGENPAAIVIGAILIIIGALFFVQQFLPNLDIDLFWPLLLVGLGILVLVIGFSRDSGTKGSPP